MRCALILPRKQVGDSTRQLRELKTRKSKSPVAMAPTLEATLRNYLGTRKQNPSGLLFPNRNGRPRKRQYVVEVRIETRFAEAGAACERRGPARLPARMGTALSENGASLVSGWASFRGNTPAEVGRSWVD
jgi:hypothetical protein